jgi:hypothetical protein
MAFREIKSLIINTFTVNIPNFALYAMIETARTYGRCDCKIME